MVERKLERQAEFTLSGGAGAILELAGSPVIATSAWFASPAGPGAAIGLGLSFQASTACRPDSLQIDVVRLSHLWFNRKGQFRRAGVVIFRREGHVGPFDRARLWRVGSVQ